MTYDIKIKQDKIYMVEKDESEKLGKKKRKIFSEAEKTLRKIIMEKLSGRGGDC